MHLQLQNGNITTTADNEALTWEDDYPEPSAWRERRIADKVSQEEAPPPPRSTKNNVGPTGEVLQLPPMPLQIGPNTVLQEPNGMPLVSPQAKTTTCLTAPNPKNPILKAPPLSPPLQDQTVPKKAPPGLKEGNASPMKAAPPGLGNPQPNTPPPTKEPPVCKKAAPHINGPTYK